MALSLQELAALIGAQLRCAPGDDPHRSISGCARLEDAGPTDVAFLANPRYASQLDSTNAAAVILSPDVDCPHKTALVADDPYFAFRKAMVELHGWRTHPAPADAPVSALAVIDPSATLGPGATIHPFAVISAGVTIGAHCVIYPHTFVGPRVRIGDHCVLYANVVIYEDCVLGHRVTLHSGTVIGQDGFGYATRNGEHHKVPQTGNVIVEDDVEMGANCSIDRATLGATIIAQGTKFSDAVTIGHGCHVGRHNLFVGQVGLAGSVNTGDYVAMGGQVGVAGHLNIGNEVQIAATSGVMNDIPDSETWGGAPAMPLNQAKRIHLHTIRLPDLVARIKKLERQLANLREAAAEGEAEKAAPDHDEAVG